MRRKSQPVLMCLTVALGLVGCSEPTEELVRATVQTAPRITTIPQPAATIPPVASSVTTETATVETKPLPQATTTLAMDDPTLDQLRAAAIDAATDGDEEANRQYFGGPTSWDLVGLQLVMTPEFADATMDFMRSQRDQGTRFEIGTIEERQFLRLRFTSPTVGIVTFCVTENSREFKISGLPTDTDDVFVQANLESYLLDVTVVSNGEDWLMSETDPKEPGTCAKSA
jgi:hypothetical protein